MYCSYCGKHNADEMLFCGYCGKPLATPDRDDEKKRDDESRALYGRPETASEQEEAPVRRADTIVPARESARPAAPKVGTPEKARRSAPAEEDSDWIADMDWEDDSSGWEDEASDREEADPFALDDDPEFADAPAPRRRSEPVREQKRSRAQNAPHPPVLNRHEAVNARGARKSKTLVPRRESDWDEGDIFMEEKDDYADRDDRAGRRAAKKRAYAYEEAEQGSFFVRHIRGFITLFLLLLVVAVIAMWTWSASGQRLLAQLEISRRPESYVRLAEEVAQAGAHEMEGYYYMRALDLDGENLDYAIRAANAYVAAGNTDKAAEALKTVIALQPDNVDAYVLLSGLYPVVSTRPAEVKALIQQGYELTGDSRLAQ